MGQSGSRNEIASNALMLGNPGIGKSTLLNCLSGGQARFKSGFSPDGTGVTAELHECFVDFGAKKVKFMDVPGLEDKRLREQACQAIFDAMNRRDGDFKIIFVVGLEAGRVRSQDATTISLILNSTPDIQLNYGIIFNKLSKKAVQNYQDPAALKGVLSQLSADPTDASGVRPLALHTFLLPKNDDLEDEDDKVIRLPEHDQLLQWIQSVPNCTIERVEKIKASNFELMQEKHEQEMKLLKENMEYARERADRAERLAREAEERQREREERMHQMMIANQEAAEARQRALEERNEEERRRQQERYEEAQQMVAEMQRRNEMELQRQRDEWERKSAERERILHEKEHAARRALEEEKRLQRESLKRDSDEKLRQEQAKRLAEEEGNLASKGVPISFVIREGRRQGILRSNDTIGGDSASPWLDNDLHLTGKQIDGTWWFATPLSAISGGAHMVRINRGNLDNVAGAFMGANVNIFGLNLGLGGVFGAAAGGVVGVFENEQRLCFTYGGRSHSLRVGR